MKNLRDLPAGATANLEGGELVIRVKLDASRSLQDADWVDVLSAIPLPRRRVLDACRSGELKAAKHGSRWLARRRDIDAFVESGTPKLARVAERDVMPATPAARDLDAEAMAALGARRAG